MATIAPPNPQTLADDRAFLGHPRGLAYLAFTEMWESKILNYDALERLVRLRDQGALSDEEFAEQKRIVFEKDGADASVDPVISRRFSTDQPLQMISAAAFATGLCAVMYSTFVYDTTISPLDSASSFSSGDESRSIQETASAIREITDRYERTMAGERIINLPRVETQQKIFSFGALLMIIGAIGFVVPLARGRR